MEGQHINSAASHPELQGNPDNIKFLTRDEHFAEHGYVPYQQGGTLEEVKKLNEEIGVTPAQKAAMEVGSMFSWNAIGADPKQYNEHGFPVKKKEEREDN